MDGSPPNCWKLSSTGRPRTQHITVFLVLGASRSPSRRILLVALLEVRILVDDVDSVWDCSSSRLAESHLQGRPGGCGAAVEGLLEAWCLSQFIPGSLYSPLQVCLQEDFGSGSSLLGLNKPLKGGLHRQAYFLNTASNTTKVFLSILSSLCVTLLLRCT